MTGKDKLLKANAFVMGSRINLELRRIAAELGRSLLTADLAVDVTACCTELLAKLEALAGCKPGELWDENGVPCLVFTQELSAAEVNAATHRTAYKGVHTVRGRRKKQPPEGGAS